VRFCLFLRACLSFEPFGRPLFRFVHDPDLISLLRTLSNAGQQVLVPSSCFIRWRSPWEQRFRRTEIVVMLLADGYTFDLTLKRPSAPEERKITRIAHINIRELECHSPTPLRQALNYDSESSSEDGDEPVEAAETGEHGIGTLRQLMHDTLPVSIEPLCSAAVDSVQSLVHEPSFEMLRGSVGAFVGVGFGLGKEAGKLVWKQISKHSYE